MNSHHEVASLFVLLDIISRELERFQKIGQSVSTEYNLSFGNGRGLIQIILGEVLVLLDSWVNSRLRDLESLVGPLFHIEVHGIGIGDLVFAHQSLSFAREVRPIVVIEGKLCSTSEFVNNRVPNSVQVLGSFFVR